MIGLVLVTHGHLADEFVKAVEHIVGPQKQIRTVCIDPEDDMERRRKEILQGVADVDNGGGVVILTDMFGGSPSNLSLRACSVSDRRILYGANLPMLIKLAKSRGKTVPEAVRAALTAGRKYIDSLIVDSGLQTETRTGT